MPRSNISWRNNRPAGNIRSAKACPARRVAGKPAHSRKGVEADFRQTKFLASALDDKEVGDERAFEASAQALTVHGRKRHDWQGHTPRQTMHDVDANIRVGAQHRRARRFLTATAKGCEITPKTEDPGSSIRCAK